MTFRRVERFRVVCGLVALTFITTTALADATYTVKSGDTVSKLAIRFNIPVEDLISRNNLKNPDLIYVGQQLKLPDNAAPATPAAQADKKPAEEAKAEAPAPAAAEKPAPPKAAEDRPLTGRELMAERARILEAQRVKRGEQIATVARSYYGSPYRRGGTSSRGMDCSGLVVRALATQGIRAPHNGAMLFKMGTPVKYKDLQPGDVLFFTTRGLPIGHVGIWVGNNKFIHAANSRRGVIVSEVAGYYAKRLVGARRLH
ncbi:MAG: NlpC/P60 family protein [Armatimonadota bacterium]